MSDKELVGVDTITELRAERDRLREHLRYIRDGREPVGLEGYARLSRRGMRRRARRALEGTSDE